MRAFEKVQRAVKARVAAMETPDQAPYPAEIADAGRRPSGEACTSDRADRDRDGISSKSQFSFLNSNLVAPRSSLHVLMARRRYAITKQQRMTMKKLVAGPSMASRIKPNEDRRV